MNNYQLNEEIGKGSFSVVYKGRRRRTVEFYAISSIEKSRRQHVLNSVQQLRSLQHPCVIEFHNWYETNHHLWVITEYCVGGDLRAVLKLEEQLQIATVRAFGIDVGQGLMHMHSVGVLVNDLKPSNLLLDDTASLRFYDFSLSCSFADASERALIGTPLYMAPELFLQDKSVTSTASDLWAFGCLLHEMATGKPPFSATSLDGLISNILRKPITRVDGVESELSDLIVRLLAKDPLQRATWAEVAANAFWEGHLPPPRSPFPGQPAFEAYRRQRSGTSRVWASEEEITQAICCSTAAAHPTTAEEENMHEEDTAGELELHKEVDFTPRERAPNTEASAGSTAGSPNVSATVSTHAVTVASSISNSNNGNSVNDTQSASRRLAVNKVRSNANSDNANHNNNGAANGTHTSPDNGATLTKTPISGQPRARPSGADPSSVMRQTAAVAKGNLSSSMSIDARVSRTQFEDYASHLVGSMKAGSLLLHSSDAHIRPLCMNNRIERYTNPVFDRSTLGFRAYTLKEMESLSNDELTRYITTIYRKLSTATVPYDERTNIMSYFETICTGSSTANILVNSSIMTLCLKLAGQRRAPSGFRCSAASIMALLVRHTTFIHVDLAKSHIIPSTLQLFLDESNARVRRKLLACIGEFLFYVAVQSEEDRAPWEVNSDEVQRVFSQALDSQDDVIRHYAAKAIENLSSVADTRFAAASFGTRSILDKLLSTYALPPAPTRTEHLRASALCAALKLALVKEELIPYLCESSLVPIASYPDIIVASPVPRTPQLIFTFLSLAFVKGMLATSHPCAALWTGEKPGSCATGIGNAVLSTSLSAADGAALIAVLDSLSDDIVESACGVVERLSTVIRSKVLFYLMFVCCIGNSTFARLCTSRHISFIDRSLKDTDTYAQRCGDALCSVMAAFIADKLDNIRTRLSPSATPLYLSVVQQLLNSNAIRSRTHLQPIAFRSLEDCISKAMTNSLYGNYENEFITIIERIVQSPECVTRYQALIAAHLMPQLLEMIQKKEGSRRFATLRVFNALVNSITVGQGLANISATPANRMVAQIATTVAPMLPTLLTEMSPIPSLTLSLLVSCSKCSPRSLGTTISEPFLRGIISYIQSARQGEVHALTLLHECLSSTLHQSKHITYAMSQKLPSVLLDSLKASMGSDADVVEGCCEVMSLLLERASADPTSRHSEQCSAFLEQDSMRTMFLPLAGGGGEAAAPAALVALSLVQLFPHAQQAMLTSTAADALYRALGRSVTAGDGALAAKYLLRGMRHALEQLRSPDTQPVLSHNRCMDTLRAASETSSEWPRTVQLESSKLLLALNR